jgi:NAD-dependent dihydropyrimidine dehydrogenase PreA subunit
MVAEGYYHAHEVCLEKCDGRMRCLRACPTGAIRVRDGKSRIISELCVDCGDCITACPHGAVVPLADRLDERSPDYVCRIAIPSPVLYSQFPSDTPPRRIREGLKQIGFDHVFDVSRACDWAVLATRIFLREHTGRWPMISSFCPAVVRLIQVKYPELTEHILAMEVPREVTAREAKKKLSKELGIDPGKIEAVYLTACPAKVVSIRQPAEKQKSWLDRAVAISEVYGPLRNAMARPENDETAELFEDGSYGPGWSRLGGMTSILGREKWIAVSGTNDVTKILDDIENSRLRDVEFIEASACLGGCIGGPLTVENIYVARSRTIRLGEKHGRNIERYAGQVESLYRTGFFEMENPLAPRPLSPLDPDIGKAIAKVRKRDEIYESLPKIDCGACGSPTCMAFAEDIVKGDADHTQCVVLRAGL